MRRLSLSTSLLREAARPVGEADGVSGPLVNPDFHFGPGFANQQMAFDAFIDAALNASKETRRPTGQTVDGNAVEVVYQATLEATTRARNGKGPTLLELETYRFAGHSRSDPGHYRSKGEVTEWGKRDPITRYETFCLRENILSQDQIEEMKAAVEKELDEAVAFAEQSPSPLPEDCLKDVYAE